ncbi:hypothetical protein [Pasteuria penetrans]|uniref:hypothetical protein n=1 Tax=Pasteuria penetrans TaxID=86005 RepID=UPI000FA086B1|nr:hypothetical protein [Pasteuria penetrans]
MDERFRKQNRGDRQRGQQHLQQLAWQWGLTPQEQEKIDNNSDWGGVQKRGQVRRPWLPLFDEYEYGHGVSCPMRDGESLLKRQVVAGFKPLGAVVVKSNGGERLWGKAGRKMQSMLKQGGYRNLLLD